MNQIVRDVHRAAVLAGAGCLLLFALVVSMSADAAGGCPVCGKNLVKNPGAELGRGVMAVGAYGAVPGWSNESGQFGAAAYAFPNGWFSATSQGPKDRGKNYFFGGTTRTAVDAKASVGKQTIALPVKAVGRKATLSGWLGNYGSIRSQVRAEFLDASGAVLTTVRIGPVVTTGSTNMVLRSRTGTVPANAKQVAVSIILGPNALSYNLAGVDNVSLVLT